MKRTTIPTRSEVAQGDRWNLDSLFSGDDSWNVALARLSSLKDAVNAFREALLAPESLDAETLARFFDAYAEAGELSERVGHYAFLSKSTDEGDSVNLDRVGRYMMTASAFAAETSWVESAIQAIPENTIRSWIDPSSPTGSRFAPYRVWTEKLLRLKAHTLSEKEERILALQMEGQQTPRTAFSVLTNVDLDFGTVKTAEGELPLSQTTMSKFLENPDRSVREDAYRKFYAGFDTHKNTIATLYTGSVNQDVADARIKGYSSARAMALFPDRVDETVYDNLVATVRANLATLHRYYALRKRALGLDKLKHWDVYVPLAGEVTRITPYDEAVSIIGEALAPLGDEYVSTITKGLRSGWVDKYENKGKRSGAFSSGGFTGDPFILMNYKDEVIRDVFTLAHEGGHSMHSYNSARNNPFLSYDYTIFEAEVASTFNEDLVFRYLMKKTDDRPMRAFLISTRASDILATLFRQTMFAEYEKKTHELVEAGTPLTCDLLRSEYRALLRDYFGPDMELEDVSDLEGLRIPHFYNAFYVYKYATGISASLALAERVCSGGKKERDDYFAFLKSGGSRYPIDALRVAGVDMEKTEPVEAACRRFGSLVDELERTLEL